MGHVRSVFGNKLLCPAVGTGNLQKIAEKLLVRFMAEELVAQLGLKGPGSDGSLRVRAFGQALRFSPPSFTAVVETSGEPARLVDRLLVVRYLSCNLPMSRTGQLIAFRELNGGQFYLQPFRARSLVPLRAHIMNDLDRLRRNLDRFDWQPLPMGDLGASIHAFGNIDVILVYRRGDEEMPPSAEMLFDACIKRIFNAEDVAAIAGRICLGLL